MTIRRVGLETIRFLRPRVLVGCSLALALGVSAAATLDACDDGDDDTNEDGGTPTGKDGGKADGGTSSHSSSSGAKKDASGNSSTTQTPHPEAGNGPDADHADHSAGGSEGGGIDSGHTDGGGGGDGGHASDGGQVVDGGHAGDAQAKGCTYTITGGPGESSGTCTATAAFGSNKLGFTLTGGMTGFTELTFGATLPGSVLTPGSYTQASTLLSGATFLVLEEVPAMMGTWAECWRPGDPCGSNPQFNDVGSFDLTITSTGPSFGTGGDGGSELWSEVCGTLTAVLPSDPDTESPGTAMLSATFCGGATTPDASAPKDSGAAVPCTITASGAVEETAACTVSGQYITGEDLSLVTVSTSNEDETVSFVIPGMLAAETYTVTNVTSLCAASASGSDCSVAGAVAEGLAGWSEQWKLNGGSNNGGTWQMQIGPETPTVVGFTYSNLHGLYTGTLPIDNASATGTVSLTASF